MCISYVLGTAVVAVCGDYAYVVHTDEYVSCRLSS